MGPHGHICWNHAFSLSAHASNLQVGFSFIGKLNRLDSLESILQVEVNNILPPYFPSDGNGTLFSTAFQILNQMLTPH